MTDLWSDFLSIKQTYRPDLQVFYQWQKQRPSYAVWMYRFEDNELIRRVKNIQGCLQKNFNIHLVEQLHFTVFVAGFPCIKTIFDDDIKISTLDKQLHRLQQNTYSPPELLIHTLSTTLTGPILLTDDLTDTTHRIRSLFSQQSTEQRFSYYCGHITLGHYLDSYDTDKVYRELIQISNFNTLSIKPDSLELIYIDCSQPVKDTIAICNEHYQTILKFYF